MQTNDALGSGSTVFNATPYIANPATNLGKKIDNVLPFGALGDLATSSIYMT